MMYYFVSSNSTKRIVMSNPAFLVHPFVSGVRPLASVENFAGATS